MLSKNEHILWKEIFLQAIAQTGEDGRAIADYIRSRGTVIGFKKARYNVGAFWTPSKRIYLNSHHYSYATSLTDAYMLSLLAHEVKHLQQGPIAALSVYGELEAWQTGYRFYHQLSGNYPGKVIAEIMSLPLGWDRVLLSRARELMQVYASKDYRVDLLPLYPINREIRYLFTGK
ncbi:MAG: hypothetical protein MUO77_04545 [Anaerolineales bacterium]|nr:hypothetical protein [Anaerolineales bacterium]